MQGTLREHLFFICTACFVMLDLVIHVILGSSAIAVVPTLCKQSPNPPTHTHDHKHKITTLHRNVNCCERSLVCSLQVIKMVLGPFDLYCSSDNITAFQCPEAACIEHVFTYNAVNVVKLLNESKQSRKKFIMHVSSAYMQNADPKSV